MQNILNQVLEQTKNCYSKKFMALEPMVPELDSMWTLCCICFYSSSLNDCNLNDCNMQFLGRFHSKEELQIFCDIHNIKLDEN